MLELASARVPDAGFVQSDALRLPFEDGTFDRVFTSHFYGHLEDPERGRFLAEARRVAPELVVVDSALRDDVEPAEPQERILNDGSRWHVSTSATSSPPGWPSSSGAARPCSRAAGS